MAFRTDSKTTRVRCRLIQIGDGLPRFGEEKAPFEWKKNKKRARI